jgi:hypothetical protein
MTNNDSGRVAEIQRKIAAATNERELRTLEKELQALSGEPQATKFKGGIHRYRPATLVLFGWSAFMLFAIVTGLNSTKDVDDCGSLDFETCRAASDVGRGIGVTLLVIVWAFFAFLISMVWLMHRRDADKTRLRKGYGKQ